MGCCDSRPSRPALGDLDVQAELEHEISSEQHEKHANGSARFAFQRELHVPSIEFGTISDALAVAQTGDRVLLSPGVYRESLVLDVGVQIVGTSDSSTEDGGSRSASARPVVLIPNENSAVVVCARDCLIANIKIKCKRSDKGLSDEASPVALCSSVAVEIWADCSAVMLGCRIVGFDSGVECAARSSVSLDDCTIKHTMLHGALLHEHVRASFKRCQLRNNNQCAIKAAGEMAVFVAKDSEIAQNMVGLHITNESSGVLHSCDLVENLHFGIVCDAGGAATLMRCRVLRNGRYGVLSDSGGQCSWEETEMRENVVANVFDVSDGLQSEPLLRDSSLENSHSSLLPANHSNHVLVADEANGLSATTDDDGQRQTAQSRTAFHRLADALARIGADESTPSSYSRSSPALHSMVPPVSYSATVRLTAQWPLSEDEDVGYFLVPSNNNAPPSIEELLTDANINKRRNKALTTTANTTAALDSAGSTGRSSPMRIKFESGVRIGLKGNLCLLLCTAA